MLPRMRTIESRSAAEASRAMAEHIEHINVAGPHARFVRDVKLR
jgi:hypothetical protein